MRELSLFSGAGGGLLGTKLLGWRCVGYVEIEEYCQKVLAQRIKDGYLDRAPIFGDICEFNTHWAKRYRGLVDVITGGFPCQAFSSAAHGTHVAENLWPEMLETVGKVCPQFIYAENVSEDAIVQAQGDLAEAGYKTLRVPLSAADLGADHPRKRHWVLADANNDSQLGVAVNAEMAELSACSFNLWATDPGASGVVNGLAHRMDRTKAIGNGQVPAVAATAWRLLT